MAKYIIDGATLTAIADKMRELTPWNGSLEEASIKPEEIPAMLPHIRQDGYDEGYSDGLAGGGVQQVEITFEGGNHITSFQRLGIYYTQNGVVKTAVFEENENEGAFLPLTLSMDKGSLFFTYDVNVAEQEDNAFYQSELWLNDETGGTYNTVLVHTDGCPALCQAVKSGTISVNYI